MCYFKDYVPSRVYAKKEKPHITPKLFKIKHLFMQIYKFFTVIW